MSSLPMAYRVGARIKKVRMLNTGLDELPLGTEAVILSLNKNQCPHCGIRCRGDFDFTLVADYDPRPWPCKGCGKPLQAGDRDNWEVIQPEGYKVVAWEECRWSPQSGFQSQSDDFSVAHSVEVNKN